MSLEREEIEEREVSRAEKLLAAGMVVFLLIGGFWVLGRIARLPARPDFGRIESEYDLTHEVTIGELRLALEAAGAQLGESWRALDARRAERAAAFQEYEFRREEYRVLVERGEAGRAELELYERARRAYERAQAALEAAEAVHAQAQAAQAQAQEAYDAASLVVGEAYRRADRAYELKLLALRLAYVLPVLGVGIFAWQRARAARNRYLIVATAFMAFGIIQAAVLAFQYSWHLFREAVQVIVSVTGTAAAVGGIVLVRRYAGDPRRVSASRLRRGLCVACGFPGVAARGHEHCPACGAAQFEPCPSCGARRPIGAAHCPACGWGPAG